MPQSHAERLEEMKHKLQELSLHGGVEGLFADAILLLMEAKEGEGV